MYLALAAISAALAVVAIARPGAGVALFAVWLAALPSSTAFDAWDYRFGLYAHDYFFLVLLLLYPYRALMAHRIPGAAQRRLSGAFYRHALVLAGVAAVGAAGALLGRRALDKYVLRDLRPIVLVLEGLVLFFFVRARKVAYGERTMLWLGVVAGVSSFVGFGLIATEIYAPPDEFYSENAFRYLAISSYVSAIVLLWIAARFRSVYVQSRHLTALALAATGAATVLAGVRTLVLATGVGMLAAGRMATRRVVIAGVVGGVLLVAFAIANIELKVARVTEAASIAGIAKQLLVRFGPALDALRTMQWWQVLIGRGMGATFEIPWFEYRGLDTVHNFVDCAYITLFVKYGLVSVVYAWLLGWACGVGHLPGSLSRGVAVFLLVLGVTMAVPYQKFTIAIPVCCAIAYAVEANSRRASIARRRAAGPGAVEARSGCVPSVDEV